MGIDYTPCVILGGVLLLRLTYKYRRNDIRSLFSPITIVELVFLYYTIIGPIHFILNGDVTYAGRDMSSYVTISWWGALVSYISILLGYAIKLRFNTLLAWEVKISPRRYFYVGLIISWMGLLISMANAGIGVEHLLFRRDGSGELLFDSSFSGYAKQLVNFSIAGLSGMFIALVRRGVGKQEIILFMLTLLISMSYFLFLGFRYRIIFIVVAFSTIYYLSKLRRPSFVLWGGALLGITLIMGGISLTRSYGVGIDMSKITGVSESGLLSAGFNDTRIFFSSGALISDVNRTSDYVYMRPVTVALLMPIPRSLYPDKPDADYLVEMNNRIWGTAKHGIAFMNYGEAYYALGWLGVFLNGLLLGIISRLVYSKFVSSPQAITPLWGLALFNGLVYVLLSRGYLAQQVTIAMLSLVVPVGIFSFLRKRLL